MKSSEKSSRRSFVKKLSGTAILVGTSPSWLMGKDRNIQTVIDQKPIKVSANDKVRLACIGVGIMGFNNLQTAVKIPGVELAAVCDLYDGRLQRAKEVYGKDLITTRDYKEILDRSDIDAVIVATSDHWHDHISIDAMNKGKAVYCEKPMVHHIDEGHAVIEAQRKTKKVFQVGSQRVSSIIYKKAKELYESGEIGQLILAETWTDRQSALGAWQYSIPPDASKETIDWNRYLGDAPKIPYDPVRFFRWRNYQDYGTGVTGDLFVHLFSGLHLILSTNGPNRIYTTGGLRYWKDGRDVPDVMIGSYDYPKTDTHSAFNLQMRVNFIDGSGGSSMIRLVGSEGVLTIGYNSVKVQRSKLPQAPGFGGWDSFGTFTEATQKDFEKKYKEEYAAISPVMEDPEEVEYKAPRRYSDHYDHWVTFIDAIKTNKTVTEDATFGLRAAAAALASNDSYFGNKIINWDPESMKVT